MTAPTAWPPRRRPGLDTLGSPRMMLVIPCGLCGRRYVQTGRRSSAYDTVRRGIVGVRGPL